MREAGGDSDSAVPWHLGQRTWGRVWEPGWLKRLHVRENEGTRTDQGPGGYFPASYPTRHVASSLALRGVLCASCPWAASVRKGHWKERRKDRERRSVLEGGGGGWRRRQEDGGGGGSTEAAAGARRRPEDRSCRGHAGRRAARALRRQNVKGLPLWACPHVKDSPPGGGSSLRWRVAARSVDPPDSSRWREGSDTVRGARGSSGPLSTQQPFGYLKTSHAPLSLLLHPSSRNQLLRLSPDTSTGHGNGQSVSRDGKAPEARTCTRSYPREASILLGSTMNTEKYFSGYKIHICWWGRRWCLGRGSGKAPGGEAEFKQGSAPTPGVVLVWNVLSGGTWR
ncbi:uncharacterized protein LOC141545113 isoform X2 [Sminthopsis crassicaudata]|uniref:uncharacterized protein LOC141545113 isoform X2 n=1 Tax=Sminthopsis crassicaudata TaxID=9301 RepID=UPI003D6840EA